MIIRFIIIYLKCLTSGSSNKRSKINKGNETNRTVTSQLLCWLNFVPYSLDAHLYARRTALIFYCPKTSVKTQQIVPEFLRKCVETKHCFFFFALQ